MTQSTQTGMVTVNGTQLYYELAGTGQTFVMIHAGVADHRQWNNEFEFFAQHYQVLRYDQRGFGRSEHVDAPYSHMQDLVGLLATLGLNDALIVMGCSMGGELAMDFALEYPERVQALIMVGSEPSGLDLDVPIPDKFTELKQAQKTGDLDLVAELETQIWFDGIGRSPDQVDQSMRQLAYAMNRIVLDHEAKQLGERQPNVATPAIERLSELHIPVLAIFGAYDLDYMLAVADYMVEHVPTARKVIIDNAAHLPNMDQPAEFRRIVSQFLENVSTSAS